MADQNQMAPASSPISPELLEWAEYWYPIAWRGLVAAGLVAAVGACATMAFLLLQWRTTNIREAHSDWRTTVLEQQTATAKAELGKSNEHIADLTVQGDKLRLGIAEANEGAKKAEATAATANAEAARLRLELDREIQKRAPRFLTSEQKQAMLAEIKGKLTEITFVVQNDLEAKAFGLSDISACEADLTA